MSNQSRARTYSIKSSHNSQQQQFFYNDFSHYNLRASSLTDFTDSVYSHASLNSTKITIMSQEKPANTITDLFTDEQLKFLTNYFNKKLIEPVIIKLAELKEQLYEHYAKRECDLYTHVNKQFSKNQQRFRSLEKQIRVGFQKIENLQTKFDRMEMKIDRLETNLNYKIESEITQIRSDMRMMKKTLNSLQAKIDSLMDKQRPIVVSFSNKFKFSQEDNLIPTKSLIQDQKIKLQNQCINLFVQKMEKHGKHWSPKIPQFLNAMYKSFEDITNFKQEQVLRIIQRTFNYMIRYSFQYNKHTVGRLVIGFVSKDDQKSPIKNSDHAIFARRIYSNTKDIQQLHEIIIKLFEQLGYKNFILNQYVVKQIKEVSRKVFICEQNLYFLGVILLISIVLIVFRNLGCNNEFMKLEQRIISTNEKNRKYIYHVLDLLKKDKIKYV